MPKSLTLISLSAVAVGLAAGTAQHTWPDTPLAVLAPYITGAGVLWINTLRLIVLPLAVSNLIAALATRSDARTAGYLSGAAMASFVALLLAAGTFTVTAVPQVLKTIPVDPQLIADIGKSLPADALRTAQRQAETKPAEWLTYFAPTNLVDAAAKDNLLPLLLLAGTFALALNRAKPPGRDVVVSFFQGLSESLLILVQWVIRVLPLAAFALSFSFAAAAGMGAAAVLGQFTVLVCGAMLAVTLLLYPLTAIAGRISIGRLAAGLLGPQLTAVTTRSSIASLPSMLDSAEKKMGVEAPVSRVVLPLAVSVFKMNRTVSSPVKLLFIAHLFNVELGLFQVASFVITVVILSFSTLGIPSGGSSFKSLPAYLAAGLPIEPIVILEATEAVADIFKTLLNVTGNLSAAVMLQRFFGKPSGAREQIPAAAEVVAGN